MTKRAALGKGLSALLADAEGAQTNINNELRSAIEANPTSISDIPLNQIEPNPFQPRATFDEDSLNELAESIKVLGLIQPITLRQKTPEMYQIISGERRFRAAKIAGLTLIPAYIRKADDAGMLEMAIVENIQRENLDAIETALSFQRLIEECNLTQEGMADRVGKKRTTVTNYLRLLKLPVEIQKAIKIGKISVGHAKALLSVNNTKTQLQLCELIIKNDLSVRQLEDKVKKSEKNSMSVDKEQTLPDTYYRMLEIVGKYFNNKISLKRSDKGNGVMTIRFKDDDEVSAFLKALEEKNS
ncbi:MAG: ParB/RepB/Spo0J family partition protein [Bacteroidales bacterium]|nr:ParB/RepB/Spo0J family partition protein [Bacteroidales bacterium]